MKADVIAKMSNVARFQNQEQTSQAE